MALIALRFVGAVSPRPLFRDLSFIVGPGDRIGLVAGNGGGKSTLLRFVAGLAEPDRGEVTLARGVRVALVPQDVPDALLTLTLHEAVRRALPPAERADEAWRAGVVLDEFEAPENMRARPVGALSGGWQRLALLARAWVTRPGALLLDEPTNHLDVDKIAWLEGWLLGAAARTPLLVASHDRRFLDTVTTHTLFLRPETSRFVAHPYTQARAVLAEDDAAEARRHARDSKEVARLRRNAGALRNIGVNSGSDLLQKKSMQLRDRAERLEESLRPAHAERSGEIRLASRATHAKVLIAVRGLTVRAPDGRALFRVETLDVRQGDRLVLLGRNGAGKSRFLATLLEAAAGAVPGVTVAPSAVVGFAAQGMAHLPETLTPHRFVSARPEVGDARATALLAGAGIGVAAQAKPIATLSPGERARLGLLALRLQAPNLYLLDEPTNHVDIAGQEALEAALLAERATCVLVSHDRSFVDAVGTRFVSIADGRAVER
jgi:ATPase subunit of ABC transporter with duplicated ATPase domains